MCGIIGYVGHRPARPLLLDGLATLEYRGYDSAGIALERDGRAERLRSVGNLASLRAAVAAADRVPALAGAGVAVAEAAEPTTGIGHTRWATHGRVSEANAHPHDDATGRIQVVLNGIVENHAELREAARGRRPRVHLPDRRRGRLAARRRPLRRRPHGRRPRRLRPAPRPLRVRRDERRRARAAGRRPPRGAARDRRRRRRAVHRLGDLGVRRLDRPAAARRGRRARRDRAPRASRSSTRRARRCSASRRRSTSPRRRPTAAGSRRTCSRRSTSSPPPWPARSRAGSSTAGSGCPSSA